MELARRSARRPGVRVPRVRRDDGEARLRQAREVTHRVRHHSADDPAPQVPRGRPRLDPGARRVGVDARPAPRAASAEDRDGHRARGRRVRRDRCALPRAPRAAGARRAAAPDRGRFENLALLRDPRSGVSVALLQAGTTTEQDSPSSHRSERSSTSRCGLPPRRPRGSPEAGAAHGGGTGGERHPRARAQAVGTGGRRARLLEPRSPRPRTRCRRADGRNDRRRRHRGAVGRAGGATARRRAGRRFW